MTKLDIALASCRDLPRPDPDEAPLVAAFERLGVRAIPVAWDDASFDWSSVRACLIRSTWDYTERRNAFVAWAERTASQTLLVNDAATIRWNTHKSYLRELEGRGVAIVPTAWAEAGARVDLRAVARQLGWRDLVVKPAVGGGARGALRTTDLDAAQAHLDAMSGDAMIQPYVPAVEDRGERSLVFFDGVFSHAIRKHAALSAGVATGAHHGGEAAVAADDEEIAFARTAMAAAPRPPLYARVDIVRTAAASGAGRLAIMELELVEPSLFFAQSPGSEDRLARALVARAEAPPRG